MDQDEMKESLERVEEALHDAEEKEKVEKRKEQWMNSVALSTAIIAVVAAIVGLFGNQATSQTILAKNEAILYENQASDAWAHFQAKDIKGKLYEINSRTASAGLTEEFQGEAARYAREKAVLQEQAENLEKKVEAKNRESEHFFEKHHLLEFSETFLHVAIALAAISALTRNRNFWLLSLLMALGGTLLFAWSWIK